MNLVSPIWLIGLAPWLGVLVYLLRGAHDRATVPFLQLWRGSAGMPRQERRWRTPPAAIVLMMVGCLLGLIAASRPFIVSGNAVAPQGIVVVIDRGISMSGRGAKDLRFKECGAELLAAMRERFSWGSVEVDIVPGPQLHRVGFSELEKEIQSLAPTACDTRLPLAEVVASHLSQKREHIFVVTDQSLLVNESRIVLIAPHRPLDDVGITRLAVREQPIPQAMIGVRNQSNQARTTLSVSSAGKSVERQIDLPAAGGDRNYFVDLPAMGETVEARLVGRDDIEANDATWVVRENVWPRIEARTPVPPALGRVMDAYRRVRPIQSDDSIVVPIIGAEATLAANSPGIIIAMGDRDIQLGPIRAEVHPITKYVSWQALGRVVRVGKPPAGWSPIVSFGDAVVVAANPDTRAQLWIGFDAPEWATTPDYVVFWTNVFDWAGAVTDKPHFAGHPLSEWTPEWKLKTSNSGLWPGIYARSDGARRAFNSQDVVADGKSNEDLKSRIAELQSAQGGTDLTSWMLLASLACVVVAGMMWRG